MTTSWGWLRRGPFFARLISWMVAVPVLVLVSQQAPAEITQPELAQIVKKAIQEKSVPFIFPKVTVANGVLNYNPGKILYPGYKGKPNQPLGFPADVQFTIELIRKYRAGQIEELAVLEPFLVRMETILKDELTLIDKHKGSQEQLLKQLAGRDDQARAILREGIRAWAAKQGLTVAKDDVLRVIHPTVTFQTVPAGGTVYYLSAVDYALYKAAGILQQSDRWNQVPGQQLDMRGVFYFRAAWPGGKTKQTAKILIDNDLTLSLQAD